MAPTPDEELDLLLKTHLSAQLDPRLGRSVAAFRQSRAPRRTIGWWIAAGSAVAAGVLLGALLNRGPSPTTPRQPLAKGTAPEEAPTIVQSATWTRLEDDGLAMVANQPARQLRRQVVDEVEWYDPRRKATVRTTVPRQQIILIGMKTD